MGATAAATLAALAGREPQRVSAQELNPNPSADAIIVLWLAGGMAQTETFDPKRYTPFEPGVRTERVLSTFPAIDTAVDHIKISQGLERIAAVMDRGAIIRTFQAEDLGYILHSRHQYHWHTGYVPPQPIAMPHIGAIVARTLGPKNADVPPFIAIGQNLEIGGESNSVKAFHTAGFLGTERAVSDRQPGGCRVGGSSTGGARREAFPEPPAALREAARHRARVSVRRRLSARVARAIDRVRRSPALEPVREGVRSLARAAAGL
jgi:hypothetical protein